MDDVLRDIQRTLHSQGSVMTQMASQLDRVDARVARFESLRELLPDTMGTIKVSLLALMERTAIAGASTSRDIAEVKATLNVLETKVIPALQDAFQDDYVACKVKMEEEKQKLYDEKEFMKQQLFKALGDIQTELTQLHDYVDPQPSLDNFEFDTEKPKFVTNKEIQTAVESLKQDVKETIEHVAVKQHDVITTQSDKYIECLKSLQNDTHIKITQSEECIVTEITNAVHQQGEDNIHRIDNTLSRNDENNSSNVTRLVRQLEVKVDEASKCYDKRQDYIVSSMDNLKIKLDSIETVAETNAAASYKVEKQFQSMKSTNNEKQRSDITKIEKNIDTLDKQLQTLRTTTTDRIKTTTDLRADIENKLKQMTEEQAKQNEAIISKISEMATQLQSLSKKHVSQLETSQVKLVDTLDRQLQFLLSNIYDVVEKESFLTRAMTLMPGHDTRSTYECSFRVTDFKRRVKSRVEVFSCPWFIPQMGTCLRGCVRFMTDGDLSVMLSHGRFPKVVGLQAQEKKSFSFTVTVVDELGNLEEKVLKQEEHCTMNEATQRVNSSAWGCVVGTWSCGDLVKDGYVNAYDELILKYVITM